MTVARRIAVKILNAVSRLAPEASQEWIDAMRGEMEVIPGDWAALAWAFGSVRLLFTWTQKRELLSVADVGRETSRIINNLGSMRTAMGLMGTLWFPIGALMLATRILHHNPMDVGQLLISVSAFVAWIQLRQMHLDDLPVEMNLSAEMRQYRTLLLAKRNLQTGVWAWVRYILFIGAFLCMIPWEIMLHPAAHPLEAALFGLPLILVACIFPALRSGANETKRKLEELDALEAKQKNL
jgi:hypothetical protein